MWFNCKSPKPTRFPKEVASLLKEASQVKGSAERVAAVEKAAFIAWLICPHLFNPEYVPKFPSEAADHIYLAMESRYGDGVSKRLKGAPA
jgi:hypothetical protein